MAKYVSLLWWAGMLIFCSCQNSGSTAEKGGLSAEQARKLEALKAESKTRPYDRIPQQVTKIKNSGLVETQGKALIYVPEGGLLDQNGKPFTGTAEIKVREALTMSDFIRYGLNTMSDKGILESGGMMEITASDTAGNPLKVNPETGLRLSMPIRSVDNPSPFTKTQLKKETDKKPDWQLFQAEKDENGTLLWKETPKENQLSVKDYADAAKMSDELSDLKSLIRAVDSIKKDPNANKIKNVNELKLRAFDNSNSNHVFGKQIHLNLMDRNEVIIDTTLLKEFYVSPLCYVNGELYAYLSSLGTVLFFDEDKNGTIWMPESCNNKAQKGIQLKLKYPLEYAIKDEKNYVSIYKITKSYKNILKKYKELTADKAMSEKIKQYDKIIQKTARLEAVIQSSGWYNCDRYTKEQQFVGHFTVEGCDTSLLPFLHTAWVQPDINVRINPYLDSTGKHYTFQGVKEKGGFLLAWIPGWYVGSIEFSTAQIKEHNTVKGGNFGTIKLQPADDKAIQALIERLTRNRNEPKAVI